VDFPNERTSTEGLQNEDLGLCRISYCFDRKRLRHACSRNRCGLRAGRFQPTCSDRCAGLGALVQASQLTRTPPLLRRHARSFVHLTTLGFRVLVGFGAGDELPEPPSYTGWGGNNVAPGKVCRPRFGEDGQATMARASPTWPSPGGQGLAPRRSPWPS